MDETPVSGRVYNVARVWYSLGRWTIECVHELTANRLGHLNVDFVVCDGVKARTVVDRGREIGIGHLEVQYTTLYIVDSVATFT